MEFKKLTESVSAYDHLEKMNVRELLVHINSEDQTVPAAVEKVIPAIEALVENITLRIIEGGRLFYIGAGTSGRLGIVDASECPPTFGVPQGLINGLIAGGDQAIRKAVEFAEDDKLQGWSDLLAYQLNLNDSVIGIAASGTTPYVIGAIEQCKANNILTGCITCNPGSPLAQAVDFPVEVATGPEFITGSTRMKAGTAQKLILNMISTSLMIRLGRVEGNRMVDMQLSNHKLIDRGTMMVIDALKVDELTARKLLLLHGSVRNAIEAGKA